MSREYGGRCWLGGKVLFEEGAEGEGSCRLQEEAQEAVGTVEAVEAEAGSIPLRHEAQTRPSQP